MNKMCIIGNLTKDPEVRVTRNGNDVCSFTVAVNRKRRGEEITTYYRVSAYGNYAENCGKYLGKGSKVYVEGELDVDLYDGNDGQKRISLDIDAKFVEFINIKKSENADNNPEGFAPLPPRFNQDKPQDEGGFTRVDTDELPF